MMLAQVIGTVIGAVTNYFTLIQVIDAKRPYLDGTLVDPTGACNGVEIDKACTDHLDVSFKASGRVEPPRYSTQPASFGAR